MEKVMTNEVEQVVSEYNNVLLPVNSVGRKGNCIFEYTISLRFWGGVTDYILIYCRLRRTVAGKGKGCYLRHIVPRAAPRLTQLPIQ
jgi:hypothetical protein